MDGEFVCEDMFGTIKGVAGGNFLILGETQALALQAAERAVAVIRTLPGVIMPFPGGIVRSGSKVGSRYKKLKASTNEAYCPTLKGIARQTALPEGVSAAYEIVIDGVDLQSVEEAMRQGIHAACGVGIRRISAGNYGGKLGPFHLHLHSLFRSATMKRRFSWGIAISFAMAHLLLTVALGLVVLIRALAHGLGDFATMFSRNKPVVHDPTIYEIVFRILILPADRLLTLMGHPEQQWMIFLVIVLNSLCWGIAVAGIIALFRRRRVDARSAALFVDNPEDDYAPIRPQDR